MDNYEKAIEYLEKATKINPKNYEAKKELIQVHKIVENEEGVIEY